MYRKSGLSVPAAWVGKCEPLILPLAEAAEAAAQPSPSPAPSSLMTEEEYAGCISVYYWDSWHNTVSREKFIIIWSWHSELINSVNVRLSNHHQYLIQWNKQRCSISITNFAPVFIMRLLQNKAMYFPLKKVYLFIASQNSSVPSWVTGKYFIFAHKWHWKCSLKRNEIVKLWLSENNCSGIMRACVFNSSNTQLS